MKRNKFLEIDLSTREECRETTQAMGEGRRLAPVDCGGGFGTHLADIRAFRRGCGS